MTSIRMGLYFAVYYIMASTCNAENAIPEMAQTSIIHLVSQFEANVSAEQKADLKNMCPRCLWTWTINRINRENIFGKDYSTKLKMMLLSDYGHKLTENIAEDIMLAWVVFSWRLSESKDVYKAMFEAKKWIDDVIPYPAPISKKGITRSRPKIGLRPSWTSWK